MRRSGIGCLGVLIAGCAPQGALETAGHGAESPRWAVAGSLADVVDGQGVGPVVEPGTAFGRLALRWDASEPATLEVRVRALEGAWGEWTPVTVAWSEADLYVGTAEPATDAIAYQIRVRPPAAARGIAGLEIEAVESIPDASDELPPDPTEADAPVPDLGEVLVDEPDDIATADDDGSEKRGRARPRVVRRSRWGARSPRCSYGAHRPARITIHHTVTPTRDSMRPAARVRQIQAFHMEGRGWCDIGYHYLIARDGRIFQGRPQTRIGSHVGNNNTGNVGIAFLGSYDRSRPNDAQLCAAAKLVGWLGRTHGIRRDRAHVKGHRQYGGTSCPGDHLYRRLGDIVRAARSGRCRDDGRARGGERPGGSERTKAPGHNPVIRRCADPAVVRHGDRWYATCTGRDPDRPGALFRIFSSTDLVRWRKVGVAFPPGRRPAWAEGDFWAPALHHVPGGFALYYSARYRGRSVIGVAFSRRPEGPYRDRGRPLLVEQHPVLDPHVVKGPRGRPFLFYESLQSPNDKIYVRSLAYNGLELGPHGPRLAIQASARWETRYENGVRWGGRVEGPWVVRRGGWYYLFYSGNTYCDGRYAVGVARRRGDPYGPFEKLPHPILTSGRRFLGPGHNAVTVGPDGERYILFHAYDRREGQPSCSDETGQPRHTLIKRIVFRGGWPRVVTGAPRHRPRGRAAETPSDEAGAGVADDEPAPPDDEEREADPPPADESEAAAPRAEDESEAAAPPPADDGAAPQPGDGRPPAEPRLCGVRCCDGSLFQVRTANAADCRAQYPLCADHDRTHRMRYEGDLIYTRENACVDRPRVPESRYNCGVRCCDGTLFRMRTANAADCRAQYPYCAGHGRAERMRFEGHVVYTRDGGC